MFIYRKPWLKNGQGFLFVGGYSHNPTSLVGKRTTFTVDHVYVYEFRFSLPFVDEVGETVASFVLIRWVNLRNITDDDNFCSFTCTSDDSLDFVRGEVLSLVNDDKSLWEGTSSYVIEDENFNLVCLSPFLDWLLCIEVSVWFKFLLYYRQIIVNWHHVRINFFIFVAW